MRTSIERACSSKLSARATGAWTAWSLNKDRDPKSDPGPFMSDAATAYAVMALEARR